MADNICDELSEQSVREWEGFQRAIQDLKSGEYQDASEILDPLKAYIDSRIKLSFAEKARYGKVLLQC